MGELHRIKKLFSRRILKPTLYTIVMIAAILTQVTIINFSLMSLSFTLGFTALISFSSFKTHAYPKNSLKREIYSFLTAILILIDGSIWSMENASEFLFEGGVSMFVDFTPFTIALIIILILNIIRKGYDLLLINKQKK
ncbi:MAG: hypothetical protein ACFFG0_07175 [Candidatus Thorarchaeota archaeon]